MAVRLTNIGSTPLRIDLASGDILLLQPTETSRPLREEDLYYNPYLDEWERRGMLARRPVKMSEVIQAEAEALKPAVPEAKRRGGRGADEVAAAAEGAPEGPEEEEEAPAKKVSGKKGKGGAGGK